MRKLLPLVLVLCVHAFGQSKEITDLRKRAEAGDDEAQYNLGARYVEQFVEGVAKDYGEAAKWYHKAAEQGYAPAQFELGFAYTYGSKGVLKDHKEAVKWYRLAAEQGYAEAQTYLGTQYYRGKGVLKDFEEAVKWWHKAAYQGDASAQIKLGGCFKRGEGVLKDYVAAYAWYNLAGLDPLWGGFGGASAQRDFLSEEMTSEQIAEAQKLSREILKIIEANKAKKK